MLFRSSSIDFEKGELTHSWKPISKIGFKAMCGSGFLPRLRAQSRQPLLFTGKSSWSYAMRARVISYYFSLPFRPSPWWSLVSLASFRGYFDHGDKKANTSHRNCRIPGCLETAFWEQCDSGTVGVGSAGFWKAKARSRCFELHTRYPTTSIDQE